MGVAITTVGLCVAGEICRLLMSFSSAQQFFVPSCKRQIVVRHSGLKFIRFQGIDSSVALEKHDVLENLRVVEDPPSNAAPG